MTRDAPFTDDDLLALMRQAESRERALAPLAEADVEAPPEPEGDACLHCGEAAVAHGDCAVCGEQGCLPRDDWTPGWGEPCLTTCSRCGVPFHKDCGGVTHVGNPACSACGPVLQPDEL